MKWSVSNIEIEMIHDCTRNFIGWAPPSIGAVNLGGDPSYDMIADGIQSPISEASRSATTGFGGFGLGSCPGELTIMKVTGLQAALNACKAAADEDRANPELSSNDDHFTQVIGSLNGISFQSHFAAGYRQYGPGFDPSTIDFYTEAQVFIEFLDFAGLVQRHIIINDSQRGVILSIPDPGVIWRRVSPDLGLQFSHGPTGSGGHPGWVGFADFFADGTADFEGTEFPFAVDDFFQFAGEFGGDWTVVEAMAALGF